MIKNYKFKSTDKNKLETTFNMQGYMDYLLSSIISIDISEIDTTGNIHILNTSNISNPTWSINPNDLVEINTTPWLN